MRNTKQSGANIKTSLKVILSSCKTTYEEGNNIPTTANLQENNERSLLKTFGKIVKGEFKKHETKMSEMISNNLQNTNDCLDEISKEMTEITKSLECLSTN